MSVINALRPDDLYKNEQKMRVLREIPAAPEKKILQ